MSKETKNATNDTTKVPAPEVAEKEPTAGPEVPEGYTLKKLMPNGAMVLERAAGSK